MAKGLTLSSRSTTKDHAVFLLAFAFNPKLVSLANQPASQPASSSHGSILIYNKRVENKYLQFIQHMLHPIHPVSHFSFLCACMIVPPQWTLKKSEVVFREPILSGSNRVEHQKRMGSNEWTINHITTTTTTTTNINIIAEQEQETT